MMLARPRLSTAILTATIVLGGLWLSAPGYIVAGLLSVLAGALAWHWERQRRFRVLAGLAVVLALMALAGTYRVASLQGGWREEQQRRTERAFQTLESALRGLLSETEGLAEAASQAGDLPNGALFGALERLLPRGRAEMAVVVFDEGGAPVGWAGRIRVDPVRDGDDLTVQFERYHAAFEVRRALPSGRSVLATGLLWVDPAVPRPHRSLVARLGAESGVELRVHAPGDTAARAEMFDYVQPSPDGDRLLFSVEPVPPDSGQLIRKAAQDDQRAFSWVLLLVLVTALVSIREGSERTLVFLGGAWAWLTSPLGALLVSEDLFSPATFVLPALRPFGSSAGHLIVTGLALLLAAAWTVHRPAGGSLVARAAGWALLAGACFAAPALATGIHPPPLGVEPGLWLSWYAAVGLPLAGLAGIGVLLADGGNIRPAIWGSVAAALVGLAAVLVSLEVTTPPGTWSWWASVIWIVPLGLAGAIRPKVARVTVAGGIAAALAAVVTWQADLSGRIQAAENDYQRLGTVEDPLAVPLLLRLADEAREESGLTTAAGLYLLWAQSDLAGQEFPARLALWDSSGSRLADVALDSLDVPTVALASLVREFDRSSVRAVHRLSRVPGQHHVLLTRLEQGRILSVVVGPRTRLIFPTRIARILRPAVDAPPLYDLSLSPPQLYSDPGVAPAGWKRERGALLTDVEVPFADGNRHVHVSIPVRGTWMTVAYGLLAVVMLQLVILGLIGLAFLSTVEWDGPGLRRSVRSFRFRLTITLAVFFIIPMLGFTVWGLSRADLENQRARDASIGGVLQDAVLSAGGVLREPPADMTGELSALAARLESDLFLYRGGRLVAASEPLLTELGLVEPLQDAATFQRLTLGDELELTRQGTSYVAPIRVGYRVVLAGPPQFVGVLATPQLASNWQRQQIQRDLSVLLLLAVVVGVAAALLGAQLAARGLSRPVADLERSAMAVGAGHPLPAPVAPPLEFERVFAAFSEMAADIRASQVALEGARQRTAAVLAQVATGVIALELGGGILLANPRAREVLGASLVEGESLRAALPRDGESIAEAVERFETRGGQSDTCEVELEGRVLRLQLARLADQPGGVVLAIDDLTDVTRAARVLAWGEMAQQVAHEIKNPLTPIRLGVQHLRRVERERPEALPGALEEITTRILAEIERLDTIARAFSRFAAPGDETAPLEPVDLAEVVREVTALYRLGGDEFSIELSGTGLVRPSRRDELREVLGNLIENARNAGAHRLQVTVGDGAVRLMDDGEGIPSALLERVFEPRFSTTTSGAGLGLAIVRRLVEGWGARIEIQSTEGRGTSVSIRWPD